MITNISTHIGNSSPPGASEIHITNENGTHIMTAGEDDRSIETIEELLEGIEDVLKARILCLDHYL